jgi:archaellum biogenesis ATPase FlaH
MQAYNLEKIFFHEIILNPEYLLKVESSFFDNSDISRLYRYAKALKLKYPDSKLTTEMLKHVVKAKNEHEILTEGKIDTIWNAKNEEHDKEWVNKTLQSWIQVKSLEKSLEEGIEYFRDKPVTMENAQQVCTDTLQIINSKGFVSFYESTALDIFDTKSHYYDEVEEKKSFGVEFWDKISRGGITPGTVWCGVGESNIGKSIWLSAFARWLVDQGHNVCYISCEMPKHEVLERIGSNMFNVKMGHYFEKMNDPIFAKETIAKYKKGKETESLIGGAKLGKLFIEDFPTNGLTVPGLQSYLVDKIEKTHNLKLDVILVDYINIMSNWRNPNSENTYMKIKQVAEDLRGMAKNNHWGVITVTQAKINAYGSTDLRLEDMGESSALGHTIDLGFGIMQDAIMYANRKYNIKIVKNRSSGYKNCSQVFDIDYDYMRISQDTSQEMITY